MLDLILATADDIPTIQKMSDIVWPVTFEEILSPEQIKYMMEMMYSTESLEKQLEEGHRYILAKEEERYLGYLSIQNYKKKGYSKIHKIYVMPNMQGKGVGRNLVEYAKMLAIDLGSEYLTLNVNRYNKALGFYERLGFSVVDTEDIDIGNGYLMEDYVLKMRL